MVNPRKKIIYGALSLNAASFNSKRAVTRKSNGNSCNFIATEVSFLFEYNESAKEKQ